MLLSLVIGLEALACASYPSGGGQLTHAAVLNLIAASSGPAAQGAHDRLFSVTTSGLRTEWAEPLGYLEVQRGDAVWMRITVIGRPACMALLKTLGSPSVEVEIGRARFHVTAVEFDALACENPTTIEDISGRASEFRGPLRMDFASPTHFSRARNAAEGSQSRGEIWLAMPAPENVFGRGVSSSQGLLHEWNRVGGEGLSGFGGSRLGARILDHHACVAKVYAEQKTADAFTGIAEYTADSGAMQHALWTLGLFAQFAGVGASRAMGMGQVSVTSAQADSGSIARGRD